MHLFARGQTLVVSRLLVAINSIKKTFHPDERRAPSMCAASVSQSAAVAVVQINICYDTSCVLNAC
jgi:hypothetical protein